MSDQAGLFDLPDPVPPRTPGRSGRGRTRETFARTVVADVSVQQWCVEPTRGMGPLLECGAVRIVGIDLSAEEKSAGLVR